MYLQNYNQNVVQALIEDALEELTSSEPKAAPLLEALQVAQSYLLTSPTGAHRQILDEIKDAITQPQKPQKLKATLEAILLYVSKPQKQENVMECKYCGCTDDNACEGGCSWVAENVCSQCAEKLVDVIKVDANGKYAGQGSSLDYFGLGVLLKTDPRSPKGYIELREQELYVPLVAMVITAEKLLNAYQEITGQVIQFKLCVGKDKILDYVPKCPDQNQP